MGLLFQQCAKQKILNRWAVYQFLDHHGSEVGSNFPSLCESRRESLTRSASLSCSLKCAVLDLFPSLPHHLNSTAEIKKVNMKKKETHIKLFLYCIRAEMISDLDSPSFSLCYLSICVSYVHVWQLLFPPPHHYRLSSNPLQVPMAQNSDYLPLPDRNTTFDHLNNQSGCFQKTIITIQ